MQSPMLNCFPEDVRFVLGFRSVLGMKKVFNETLNYWTDVAISLIQDNTLKNDSLSFRLTYADIWVGLFLKLIECKYDIV